MAETTNESGIEILEAQWRDRTVSHSLVPPDQLLAHPQNFRRHSAEQREAMKAILGEVGWIDEVIVNETTQHVINGHMRVEIALEQNEPLVPVRFVQLSEAEEKVALAAFDTVSQLATHDSEIFSALFQETEEQAKETRNFLSDVIMESDERDTANPDVYPGDRGGKHGFKITIRPDTQEDFDYIVDFLEQCEVDYKSRKF